MELQRCESNPTPSSDKLAWTVTRAETISLTKSIKAFMNHPHVKLHYPPVPVIYEFISFSSQHFHKRMTDGRCLAEQMRKYGSVSKIRLVYPTKHVTPVNRQI